MMQLYPWHLQVLERALRTGTVLLAASQADTIWSLNCGDAIEDVKQAVNRHALYLYFTCTTQQKPHLILQLSVFL